MTENGDSWFTFKITETDGDGIEVPKLARLLSDLSAAFYAIARLKTGSDLSRPGPRTAAEDALAAVRLVKIVPGSATIEFAPPVEALQAAIPGPNVFTVDGLVDEFLSEVELVQAGDPVPAERRELRQKVRDVMMHAGEIGAQGEFTCRPLFSPSAAPAVKSVTFRTREIPEPVAAPERTTRSRRLVGHAYMVDVEPGRQRLRLKVPEGRDVTIDVDQALLARMNEALDRAVELQVEEEVEGTSVTSQKVRDLTILPTSGPGSDRPPKSAEELAQGQGLPAERPDYVALASAVWDSEDEVTKFDKHLASVRRAEAS